MQEEKRIWGGEDFFPSFVVVINGHVAIIGNNNYATLFLANEELFSSSSSIS
jgi:hypothetical protein